MFTRNHIAGLAFLAISAFGQTTTTLNLSTQGRNADFSNFPFTRPLTQGSSLPSTCQVGQLFFNTAAPVGANVFACASPNAWTPVGSGNSYSLPQATSSTLGGVTVPSLSGLNITADGALSVLYGSGPNTAAEGNDTRITGALQSVNNLSDVGNVATALQNLQLTGATPLTISASTTGNAATATKLAVTPAACASGQYATAVAVSGNAMCSQVQYSQIGGTPAPYSLPAATATSLGGVIVGSGLSVSSGTVSANIGTTAGTIAAGNDARITGALQIVNNLSDVANVSTALQNLKLTGSSPSTISAPTTGNAATATKLAATPATCASGQYATGIAASGNAACAQVQYTQLSGTPAPYSLPAATSSVLGGVMVGSGLAVSSGTLSANTGTVSGTVAAGNDTRITGALQSGNNLSDVANVATALQNLKLAGSNPVTIASATTGNAATATSLQGTGALQILGGTGSAPAVTSGQLGMWFDSTDSNLHLVDPSNNKSTLIRTSSNGTSTNCAANGFVTGFQSNGVPSCGSLSAINGKIGIVSGGSTAVASCGTSPVLTGNDSAATVAAGAGTVTSCTITFSSAFANAPICTSNDDSNFVLIKPSATTTALTLSAQSSFGGDTLSYICIGK